MKFIQIIIVLLACVAGSACQNAPSHPKALQSQVVTNPIVLDTVPPKIDRPTQFDHPQLLGEWVIKKVLTTNKATEKHYLKAQVSLGNDQRFKMTTAKQIVQTGFWKANEKGTKMRWIIKNLGMVKLDVESIAADEVTLRIYSSKDLDTKLVLARQ